jgi:hypothetical protein
MFEGSQERARAPHPQREPREAVGCHFWPSSGGFEGEKWQLT